MRVSLFLIFLSSIFAAGAAFGQNGYGPYLPLTAEDDPLSSGYIIVDSSGHDISRVGTDFFSDDIWTARCLDNHPVEDCEDEIIDEALH